jgi:hypothetical protein
MNYIAVSFLILAQGISGGKAFAAKGDASFPRTREIVEKSSVNVPQPAGCNPKILSKLFERDHFQQVGVCGALKPLYEEAVGVRSTVFNDLQGRSSVYDNNPDKTQCHGERRIQLHTNGLNSTNTVDARVRKEESRIEDLCDQAKKNFQASRQRYQSECAKEFLQGPLQAADRIEKEVQEIEKENEEARKKYEELIRSDRARYRQGIAQAQGCDAQIKTK